jgi:hypothetical protein
MKKLLFLCFILIPFSGNTAAQDTSPVYTQSYTILIDGSIAGKETVTEVIHENGNLLCTSEHEVDIRNPLKKWRRFFSTKMVLPEGAFFPVSYSYKSDVGISYDLSRTDIQITSIIQREQKSRESTVPFNPDMVLLDPNVYHLYDYWIRKYDTGKGGLQALQTFVPHAAVSTPIMAEAITDSDLNLETGTLHLRNYRVEVPDVWTAALWVDNDNRLVRIFISGPNIEVIRTDLLPEIISEHPEQKRP